MEGWRGGVVEGGGWRLEDDKELLQLLRGCNLFVKRCDMDMEN